MPDSSDTQKAPVIPDHDLVRRIGQGSYGDVWMAKTTLGSCRAVKIVRREHFDHDRPFEREFSGIRKFEPISRTHPGLVAVLHVGRNQPGGYFYYVMEVADDLESGQRIDPQTYTPKTLSSLLRHRGKLPVPECVQISLHLTAALDRLHQQGLVHRDIKPSNIIFVEGQPKFADIGLVTAIGEAATYVGTTGYLPPEGPGNPRADLFSLGIVLREMAMGRGPASDAELPTDLPGTSQLPELLRLNEIILRSAHPNPTQRYQSAGEMHAALAELQQSILRGPLGAGHAPHGQAQADGSKDTVIVLPKALRVVLLYKSNAQPDGHLLQLLGQRLDKHGCQVFFDKHLAVGMDWARAIESEIRQADAVIILLSATSVQSEMIVYEVETAHQAAQQQKSRPRLLPIRVQLTDPLPSALACVLDPLQYFLWKGPEDDELLVEAVLRALETSLKGPPPNLLVKLESIGGAVPLESQFYVVRSTDQEFRVAIARRDSVVLVKGARQTGKTSLLARGLHQARETGAKVVLTDFQKLNAGHLATIETFFKTLGEFLADQLELDSYPADTWDPRRSPNLNFQNFLKRKVLGAIPGHFVWGLDEVDRLFACEYANEVFGLFRSWHNDRALDPTCPWRRLTLVIAYATEAHLFITDVNQSPFNVGTRLSLDDFTPDQVADLNRRYGSPLHSETELRQFHELLGGQPYLVRRSLNELTAKNLTFPEWSVQTDRDEGLFGDHLRRILVLLAKDADLCEVVRKILRDRACPDPNSFYRLRSAGLVTGDAPQEVKMRCQIYASYLRRHLG